MTLFEYLTVAVSIVISLAVVRIFGGFRAAMNQKTRYWVHLAWLFLILYACAFMWWVLWGARDATWNFPLFIYVLIGPGFLYMQASALVPADPDKVTSWHDQFFKIRTHFFVINALMTAHLTLAPFLIVQEVLPAPTLAIQATLVGVSVLGAIYEKKIVQTAIAFVFAVNAVVGIVALAFAPM